MLNTAVTGGDSVFRLNRREQRNQPRELVRFLTKPKSPLRGVSTEAWTQFVALLEVQSIDAISESGGLGSYDIRPRRLVELGYASNLRSVRTNKGRQIHVCDFIAPWTKTRFLTDPIAQYTVLVKSILLYYRAVVSGDLKKPDDVSLAGALVVLHCGGRGALKSWPKLFEHTRALYESARGAF